MLAGAAQLSQELIDVISHIIDTSRRDTQLTNQLKGIQIMATLNELRTQVRRKRQQVLKNLDENLDYIDKDLGQKLDEELKAIKSDICKLTPSRDSFGDMLLSAYA